MRRLVFVLLFLTSFSAMADTDSYVKMALNDYCKDVSDILKDYASDAQKPLDGEKKVYKSLCSNGIYKTRSKLKLPESTFVDFYAVQDSWNVLKGDFGNLNTPLLEGLRDVITSNQALLNSGNAEIGNISYEVSSHIRDYVMQARSENQKIRNQ